MCHIVAAVVRYPRKEFDKRIAYHEIFRPDGHRQGKNKHLLVGEQHAESQQDAIHGSRCPHGGHHVQVFLHGDDGIARVYPAVGGKFLGIVDVLHGFLDETRPDAAHQVVEQETLGTPYLLQDAPEHPYGKHVEKDMGKIGMHEHVGNQLRGVEIVGYDQVKPKVIGKVDAISLQYDGCQVQQHVDDEEVFGNSGYCIHKIKQIHSKRCKSTNKFRFMAENCHSLPAFSIFPIFFYGFCLTIRFILLFLWYILRSTLHVKHIFCLTNLTKLLRVMNKSELIDAMAVEAGLPKIVCKKALEAFVATVVKAMKENEKISVVGFGTFTVVKRAARTGYNPATKQPIEIAAKKSVKFRPGNDLVLN